MNMRERMMYMAIIMMMVAISVWQYTRPVPIPTERIVLDTLRDTVWRDVKVLDVRTRLVRDTVHHYYAGSYEDSLLQIVYQVDTVYADSMPMRFSYKIRAPTVTLTTPPVLVPVQSDGIEAGVMGGYIGSQPVVLPAVSISKGRVRATLGASPQGVLIGCTYRIFTIGHR